MHKILNAIWWKIDHDAKPDFMVCPICRDNTQCLTKCFQCSEIICNQCYGKLDKCPVCRVQYKSFYPFDPQCQLEVVDFEIGNPTNSIFKLTLMNLKTVSWRKSNHYVNMMMMMMKIASSRKFGNRSDIRVTISRIYLRSVRPIPVDLPLFPSTI